MSNKLYGANVDYLVEGSKNKGYLKNSSKGFGDGKTSTPNNDFNSGRDSMTVEGTNAWFEGKKSKVGVGGRGATGV